MLKKIYILLFILLLVCSANATSYYEGQDFSINFNPSYPLIIGQETKINIKTDLSTEQIAIVFENKNKVLLKQDENIWSGKYFVAKDLKSGWQDLDIYFSQKTRLPISWWEKFLSLIRLEAKPRYKEQLIKRSMKIRVAKEDELSQIIKEEPSFKPPPMLFLPPYASAERIVITTEAKDIGTGRKAERQKGKGDITKDFPLKIKGSRIFAFTSKSMEGSKEAYLPGASREESLRLNVAGFIDETEIDANFFSTSSISTTQISSQEENVSILLKRGSSEAYMGDFTANFTENEFTKLNQVLSGIRVKGDYKKWGFKAIASTPKGFPKLKRFYGDGTQGPYRLDFTPVVVDSERVYLDNILQKRGDDYTVDYNAGTITFRQKTITTTQIIEIYYDYRKSVYQHNLYAARFYVKPTPRLKIGTTYINDSDQTTNAQNIQSQTGINPIGHHVFGIDSSLLLGDGFKVDTEVALSSKNHNLISAGTKESGTAYKIGTSGQIGAFGLTTKYKKINPGFVPIAEADPKTNLLDYGAILTFKPNQILFSQLGYDHNRYTESGINYEIINRNFKNRLTLPKLPSLEYTLLEFENSNDPVTGTEIRRITTTNRVLSNYKNFSLFDLSAKVEKERRLNQYPTEEVTTYDTAAAGISTKPNLMGATAAFNFEYKKTSEPVISPYSTKTYDLKLGANPNPNLLLSGSMHLVEDKKEGNSNVTDIIYQVQPTKALGSSGKYTVQSINETFGSDEARVSKQTASIKFDLRPIETLRLRYYYKPNFTLLDNSGQKIYNNENQQTEIYWNFFRQATVGYTYKTTDNFTIDKSSYPTLFRNQSTLLSKTNLYTLKAAPLNFLSTEFNFSDDDSRGSTLVSTSATTAIYRKDNSDTKEYSATIKTSLTRAFAIDTKYIHKTTLNGTEEANDDQVYTIDQTGSLKGIWNLNTSWQLSASGAFTLSRNLLANNKTYTISPNIGFIYRYNNIWRIDGEYTYFRSYSAIISSGHKFSLRGKYTLSKYVNLSLRYDRETSNYPYYRTTDIAGIVEINM